jgi:hypothetical protein
MHSLIVLGQMLLHCSIYCVFLFRIISKDLLCFSHCTYFCYADFVMWLDLPAVWLELQCVDPLLGNNCKTNSETTSAAGPDP